jgi:ATP citrate (pro-S)-lyase
MNSLWFELYVNNTPTVPKPVNAQGIGHRIKSLQNPDMRVSIMKEFAKRTFTATPILDYALEVEQITTKKKSSLILNVDGVIATCFVDMLRSCGAFTREEADELIEHGCLNGASDFAYCSKFLISL